MFSTTCMWVICQIILASEPPSLIELERFPNKEICKDCLAFHDTIHKQLEINQALYPYLWWEFQEIIARVEHTKDIWLSLYYARNEEVHREYRTNNLIDLKRHLTKEQWMLGQMPEPIPIESFRRVE